MEPWLLQAALAALIAVVGYLLRQKDEEQAKSIALLFKKHDEDSERLNRFELRIAQEHYIKPELDNKFEKLENAFKHGFETLGGKFDNLAGVIVAHVAREDARDENRQK